MSKEKEQEVKAEDLNLELPSSILTKEFEDDDSDMPLPETADYKDPNHADDDRVLLPTPKFYKLFNECLGKMPAMQAHWQFSIIIFCHKSSP